MGAGYRKSLTHWSSGKYADASNPRQDDIEIITNDFNHIRFRDDDHGDEATPLQLEEDGILRGSDIIETRLDFDTFSFEHTGGPVNIQANPAGVGGNLDVVLVLCTEDETIGDFVPEDVFYVEIAGDLEAGTCRFPA